MVPAGGLPGWAPTRTCGAYGTSRAGSATRPERVRVDSAARRSLPGREAEGTRSLWRSCAVAHRFVIADARQRTGCPMPSMLPSLSRNHAARSPRAPLLG
jgi:hypothetical protein